MTRVFLWKLTTGLSLCVLTASMLRKNGSTLHPACEENVRLSGKDLDLENEYLIYTHTLTPTISYRCEFEHRVKGAS